MTEAEIILPIGDEALRLRASGGAAAAVLSALGRLFGYPAQPPTGVRPDVELREEEEPDRSSPVLFSIRTHRAIFDGGVPVLCRRPRRLYEERHHLLEWRLLLALAVVRAAADGRRIALLHGALLGEPFSGTVLFGASGIGKSTAMKRYLASGGSGLADDQMLLGWKENRPVVHPLPTWKTFRNDQEPYSGPAMPLLRLLCLDRAEEGEEEAIRPQDARMFQLRLFDALLEHVRYALRSQPESERRRAAETICDIAQNLSRQFEPRLLAARLDGDLLKTLSTP